MHSEAARPAGRSNCGLASANKTRHGKEVNEAPPYEWVVPGGHVWHSNLVELYVNKMRVLGMEDTGFLIQHLPAEMQMPSTRQVSVPQ